MASMNYFLNNNDVENIFMRIYYYVHQISEMTGNVSHIVEIIEAFDIFDKNGDGVIAGKEVGPILRILGQNPTEAEINKFVSSADLEGKHKNVFNIVII
jgi:Ca2+-binding EF-hand superfamily protein